MTSTPPPAWDGPHRPPRERRRAKRRDAAKDPRADRLGCGDVADAACCADSACDFCTSSWLLGSLTAICWYAARHRLDDRSGISPAVAATLSPGTRGALRLVRSYQVVVSERRELPVCPMTPSCSRYAMDALSRHGLVRGGWLTAGRLRRCSPRRAAYDPVP